MLWSARHFVAVHVEFGLRVLLFFLKALEIPLCRVELSLQLARRLVVRRLPEPRL
jgi:hypothetical protein